MKIVSFIEEREIIRRILKHCNLWKDPPEKVPKITIKLEDTGQAYEESVDFIPDYLC